jgi:hypothetical protein
MKLFEGKTKEEKNKMIILGVVGLLASLAVINLVFSPFSGPKKSGSTTSAVPTKSPTPNRQGDVVVQSLPGQNEIDSIYARTPVMVQLPPGAPDSGRNIFAFFEPPKPTPYSPTPIPPPKTPKPETPVPMPTPNVFVSFVNKQSSYMGEPGFRLEIGGDKFTPETQIWFGGMPLPTNFVSPQQLAADVPSNYLAIAGQKIIEVKSADNKLFSNQVAFNIQAPPIPQFQYVGVVARKRGNNDTAYILETGKTVPSGVRLNDIVGGRFRVISISPTRMLVKDINLGFLSPYPVELVKGAGGTSTSTTTTTPSQPIITRRPPGFPDPSMVQQPTIISPSDCPPGIPCDKLQRVPVPNMNRPNPRDPTSKDDVDDDEP